MQPVNDQVWNQPPRPQIWSQIKFSVIDMVQRKVRAWQFGPEGQIWQQLLEDVQ